MPEQASLAIEDARPYEVLCDSRAPEWLELRNTGIGASDIAVVLGLSPWKTPFQLWAEKTGLRPPDDLSDNEPVFWGSRLESIIVEVFGERTKRPVLRAGELLRSRAHPWALSTLDAWTGEGGPLWPLEIKTTSSRHADAWAEGPPDHYMAQVQQQLLVTGEERATVACLLGGQRLIWCDIEREERWINMILRHGAEFWRLVEERDPPAVDGSRATTEALNDLFPADDGAAIVLPEAMRETVEELAELRAHKRLAEDKIRECENTIKLALGRAPKGIFPGGLSVSWQSQTRKSYTVPEKTYRVLRVHEPKR